MTSASKPAQPYQLQLAFLPAEAPPEPPQEGSEEERERLFTRLDALLGGRLRSLHLTRNRTRILSSARAGKGDPQGLRVRIHHSFSKAPEGVLEEAAIFLSERSRRDRRRRALAVIRGYFDEHRQGEPPAARRASPAEILMPFGEVFDLQGICEDLKRRLFAEPLSARITWGRRSRRSNRSRRGRRSRSVQLGSYHQERDLIRIHPVLDDERTPRFVVESIVYHELLHAAIPATLTGTHRRLHGPEFRRRERLFPDHERAEAWIKKNLPRLLRERF